MQIARNPAGKVFMVPVLSQQMSLFDLLIERFPRKGKLPIPNALRIAI